MTSRRNSVAPFPFSRPLSGSALAKSCHVGMCLCVCVYPQLLATSEPLRETLHKLCFFVTTSWTVNELLLKHLFALSCCYRRGNILYGREKVEEDEKERKERQQQRRRKRAPKGGAAVTCTRDQHPLFFRACVSTLTVTLRLSNSLLSLLLPDMQMKTPKRKNVKAMKIKKMDDEEAKKKNVRWVGKRK